MSNPEIPNLLLCGYCETEFIGTKNQVNNAKYRGMKSYCSDFCRKRAAPHRKWNPYPNKS